MPLASTKVLPFAVSAVFSICADAADEARMKVKAAIAANVLDVAALLLMKHDEDADASPGQTLEPENYSADVLLTSKTVSPQLYFRKRA